MFLHAKLAACDEPNTPKQVAPDPLIRESSACSAASASSTFVISGQISFAGTSRSFRILERMMSDAGNAPFATVEIAGFSLLVRPLNISGVDTSNLGFTSTNERLSTLSKGVICSPIPWARNGLLWRHMGTSAPNPRAIFSKSTELPQYSCNANRAAAASADPPPMPLATGRFFVNTIETGAGSKPEFRTASLNRNAADVTRFSGPDVNPSEKGPSIINSMGPCA